MKMDIRFVFILVSIVALFIGLWYFLAIFVGVWYVAKSEVDKAGLAKVEEPNIPIPRVKVIPMAKHHPLRKFKRPSPLQPIRREPPSNSIVYDMYGRIIGLDPDINIRSGLRRDR